MCLIFTIGFTESTFLSFLIHVMGNVSSTPQWASFYVMMDLIFQLESPTDPWSASVNTHRFLVSFLAAVLGSYDGARRCGKRS